MSKEDKNNKEYEMKDFKQDLKDHLKTSSVIENIENKLTKINQIIIDQNNEPKSNSSDVENQQDFTKIPVYQQALSYLDKQYHMFEHNFFPNVNKYSNNLLDERISEDNHPELAHANLKTVFDPKYVIKQTIEQKLVDKVNRQNEQMSDTSQMKKM
jgi:hypothetical protein